MAAAMNGMALHGGVIPYSGTFLVFSDYARPAMRLASLMGIRSIFVMTHDSIGLGEDGPTHQPVEQLAALRAIPNHTVFRPADATEAAECWQLALESEKTPSTIALTRQNLAAVAHPIRRGESLRLRRLRTRDGRRRGAVTIFASGSEVEIALGRAHGAPGARPSDARRLGAVLRAVRTAERRLQGRSAMRRSRSPSRPASGLAGTVSSALTASSSA